MIDLRDQTISDQTIELQDRDGSYLGPDLVLRRCRVVLKVAAKGLVITKTRFEDCQVEVKKSLATFSWCDSLLTGCRFSGTLVGSDFGHWPEIFDPNGGISDCDFSAATLDGCRFIDCDLDGIKLPGWPCFTILDPASRVAEMKKIKWPGRASILAETFDELPPKLAAITFFAPTLAKDFKTTDAALKEALEQLGAVRF
jgi:hypothetical protein